MLIRALLLLALVPLASGCQKVPPLEDFTSTEYKFKARFPGKPKMEEKPGPMNTTLRMFGAETRDGVCGVGVVDVQLFEGLPPEAIAAALQGGETEMVKNLGGTLKSSSSITLDGKYPGREFSASITQPKVGQVRAKLFLVGKRMYQVIVMGTDSYATNPKATEFLNSFQLLN
jgi:hypothetical protein